LNGFLEVEGLKHAYEGRQVLDVDRLELGEKEILAVIGPNGSGKSTLLRIMNLLEKPAAGELTFWNGARLSAMSRAERKELSGQMAMIFQEPLLFKRNVRANIAYGLKIHRVPREESDRRVKEMLERLEIEDLAGRDAMTLSGGEAQKVALGRAMVLRPRLLLLDEPLASLDVPARKSLRADISRLVKEMGVTAVYVTHDYHEVLEIADRLAVLIDGRPSRGRSAKRWRSSWELRTCWRGRSWPAGRAWPRWI
jgi:tungstate transport system ATP-binding protein